MEDVNTEASDVRDSLLLSEEEENYMVGKLAGTRKKPWSQINNPPYDSIEISSYIIEEGPNATSYEGPYNYYVPGVPAGTRPLAASGNTQGVIFSNIFSSITFNVYKYFASSSPDSKHLAAISVAETQFSAPDTLSGYFPLHLEDTIDIIKVKSLSQKAKPLPTSPPPMRDNPKCCQETAEMLADIYEVLAVDELLSKKLKVPNRLVATNAKGSQLLNNYLEILAFIIRENDHLGIHPFTAILQDANEAQEGDQTIEETYVNSTAAIKKIIELLLENKGDSSNRLNLLVRLAWINVQILNALTVAVRGIQGLISFLGMPVREVIDKVTMPFDVTLGRREKAAKGFGVNIKGKKPSREEILKTLDLNEEDDLEAILPEFLETTDQPVKSETFNDDNGMGLIDMLRIVLRR